MRKMGNWGLIVCLFPPTVTRRWVTPKIWKPLFLAESDPYTSDTSLKDQIFALNGVLICQGSYLWSALRAGAKNSEAEWRKWFYKLADIFIKSKRYIYFIHSGINPDMWRCHISIFVKIGPHLATLWTAWKLKIIYNKTHIITLIMIYNSRRLTPKTLFFT